MATGLENFMWIEKWSLRMKMDRQATKQTAQKFPQLRFINQRDWKLQQQ
jgi:hypothetical protein